MRELYTMWVKTAYFLILIVPSRTCDYENISSNDIMESKLVMAFMVFRHGDRAPTMKTMPYITEKEKVLRLIQNIGYGQLTNSGKRTSYKTGLFIRHRYGDLLSTKYNQSEIYIRSTDSTRTKMTVLTAMSAVYPREDRWCEDQEWCEDNNWTPIPYTTNQNIYDFNLAIFNCPVYISFYDGKLKGPVPNMSHYFKFLDEWSQIIDYNVTQTPCISYLIYDAYYSQKRMGVPLDPKLETIYPIIKKVAGECSNYIFGNEKYIHLGAGVLLKEFFKAANKVISGEKVPKVYVYSGHDTNVLAFMAATKATPQTSPPKYGSLYALELRRVVASGEHIVVPVFLKNPEDREAIDLAIEGCEGLCELSKFYSLVSKYELDVKEWRRQCQWSEDYDFNYSLID